jgi:hypothetical protein
MTGPAISTIKRLFALSANQCAFPQCGRAIIQPDNTVTGEICHIAAVSNRGPRFDPLLSADDIHLFKNLILLCEQHHKIVDGDIKTYSADYLRMIKAEHEKRGHHDIAPEDIRRAEQLYRSYLSIQAAPNSKIMVNSPGSFQADKITIVTNRKKRPHVPPLHPDALAAHLSKRNYIKYLIDRYNKFQHADKNKVGKGKYIVIYNAIKKEFGMKWDDIPLAYFDNLAAYLQRRILNSKLGRIRNARELRCFSTYEEWITKPDLLPLPT